METSESSITLRDIEIFAYHGVYDHERIDGTDFLVTVTLDFDADCAMRYDDLEHTVNYAEVAEIVRKVMATPSNLLENVTYRIITSLTEAFPIVTGGRVSVTKVNPPVGVPNAGATFSTSFRV